jgi:hypothetical protein
MEKKSEKIEKNKSKEVKIATIIFSVLIAVAIAIATLGILIYGFGLDNNLIKKVEKIIPYPAVIIGYSHFISISELNSNSDSVKKFYESQDFSQINMRVDFSTESGKKRLKIKEKEILNRMIEDKAIEIIAKNKGISISNELVDQSLSRKLEEYKNEDDLKTNLDRLYGWDENDFKKKIVRPDIYKQELEKYFEANNSTISEAKSQIEKAKEELDKNKDFSETAKKYSKGSTAQDGGELGWFKKNQLIPEISDAVFSLEKGKKSEIIESSLGFHIVEIEDKKTENENELAKIRQIFIPKKTFADFLTEEMKKMRFTVTAKDYSWNKETQMLEFKKQDMKDFEKDTIENFQGDASVLF